MIVPFDTQQAQLLTDTLNKISKKKGESFLHLQDRRRNVYRSLRRWSASSFNPSSTSSLSLSFLLLLRLFGEIEHNRLWIQREDGVTCFWMRKKSSLIPESIVTPTRIEIKIARKDRDWRRKRKKGFSVRFPDEEERVIKARSNRNVPRVVSYQL